VRPGAVASVRTFVYTRGVDPRVLRPDDAGLSALSAAGLEVVPRLDGPFEGGRDDVVLVRGNVAAHRQLWRSLAAAPPDRRPFTALWHVEPLPLPDAAGLPCGRRRPRETLKHLLRDPRANDPRDNLARIGRLASEGLPDLLVVGHRSAQMTLRERGIRAEWVPQGYHAGHGAFTEEERDVDVLFLGMTGAPRRRRLIRALRRDGVDVRVAGRWGDPRYHGEGRTALLNRVRVLLHVGQQAGEMAHMRFLLGMANGALVVSESVYDSAPFVAGEHYLSAAPEGLAALIIDVLGREDERRRIAAAGHRFATGEVTLERSVERLVGLIPARERAGAGERR
jgi:hypothetical protein